MVFMYAGFMILGLINSVIFFSLGEKEKRNCCLQIHLVFSVIVYKLIVTILICSGHEHTEDYHVKYTKQ